MLNWVVDDLGYMRIDGNRYLVDELGYIRVDTRAGSFNCTPGKTIPCGNRCRTPANCKKVQERQTEVQRKTSRPTLQQLNDELDTLEPTDPAFGKTLRAIVEEEKRLKLQQQKQAERQRPTPEKLTAQGKKLSAPFESALDEAIAGDNRKELLDRLTQKFLSKDPSVEGKDFNMMMMALPQPRYEAIREMEKLRKSILERGMKREDARAIVDEIEVDLPDLPGNVVEQLKDTLTEFMQMTRGKGSESLRRLVKEDDRAWASASGDLNVGVYAGSKTVIFHEAGHHIEHENYGIRKSMEQWRLSRAKSDTPVPLRKIQRNSSYDKDEMALEGDYIDPYIGKVYEHGSTEVLSVGIQHFASAQEMVHLYEKDKDYFNLILGVIAR